MSAPITIEGNLAYDPELRLTPSGKATCRIVVMTSRRYLDKETQEWRDADVTGWQCQLWEQLAENVANSLHKGDPVIVSGLASEQVWDDDKYPNGKARQIQIKAKSVALSLARGTVVYTKTQGGYSGSGGTVQRSSGKPPVEDDPWAVVSKKATQNDEPPF